LHLVSTALEIFACTRQRDGAVALVADPSLICYEAWWWRLFPVSVVALLIYGLGIPLTLGWWLRRSKDRLTEPEFALRYGALYAAYKLEHPYWESVVMLEKAVIALIGMILTGFVSLQLAMLGVLFTVTIVVSKGRDPYVRKEDNRLQEVLRWCSLVVLSAGHTFHTDDFPNDTVRSILTVTAITCIAVGTAVVLAHVARDLWKVRRAQKVTLPTEFVSLMGDLFSPQGIAVASRWFQLCADDYRERWLERVNEALVSLRDAAKKDPGSVRPVDEHRDDTFEPNTHVPCTDNEALLIQSYSSQLWQTRVVPAVRAWLFATEEDGTVPTGVHSLRHGLLDWLAAIAGTETGSAIGEVRDPTRACDADRATVDLLYGRFVPVSGAVSASRVASPAWRDALQRATIAHVQSDGIPLHGVAKAVQRRPVSKWQAHGQDDDKSDESASWSESASEDAVSLAEVVTDLESRRPAPNLPRPGAVRAPFGTASYSDDDDDDDPTPRPGPN
jgi:hypothetical protein